MAKLLRPVVSSLLQPVVVPGLSLTRAGGSGGGAAPAHEQLLTLATDDGWTVLYDPTHPDNRTLREDGGNSFLSAVSDGLGNLPDLVQGTAVNQAQLSVGEFGQLDAAIASGNQKMATAAFTAISQPYSFVILVRFDRTDVNQRIVDGDNDNPIVVLNSSVPEYVMSAGSPLSIAAADTNAHVMTVVFNGASSKAILDGQTVATGDAGTGTLSAIGWLARTLTTAQLHGAGGVFGVLASANETKLTAMANKIHELTGIAKA